MKVTEVLLVCELSTSYRRLSRLASHKLQLLIIQWSIDRDEVDELIFAHTEAYSRDSHH